jgi:hypothetical protein
MNPVFEKDLREQLDRLPPEALRQVLDFARSLALESHARGSGQALCRFAGAIPRDDLALIARAIDDGCEKVSHECQRS